jgi:hypothetical protein
MAVIMTTLGFQPKGRDTIRRMTSSNRTPRRIEPWVLQPQEGTTLAKLERAYLDALESVDAVEQRKLDAVSSKKYTEDGVAADVLQFAASKLAPKLHRARRTVEAAKVEAALRRSKLVLEPFDKTDAAGQMRRLWKLDRFNALPDKDRNALTANVATVDPELAQAFLELPEYSKILPTDLEQVRDLALRAQHGDETLTEQRDLEAGIAIAEDVLAAARQEVAADAGGFARFNAAAAPYEKAASTPWLRKYRQNLPNGDSEERIGVWDPEHSKTGIRPATAQELADGIYYQDIAAYRRAQNGDLTSMTTEKSDDAA